LGTGGWAYAHDVEPRWVDVESLDLELPRLAPEFDGYRVAQISDLHADDRMTPERLAEVVGLVNGEGPDLVAITGDFVTSNDFGGTALRGIAPRLTSVLSGLRAPDGVVFVLGNHDHWTDPEMVLGLVSESGATDLNNRHRTIRRGEAELHLAGIDDFMGGRDRLDLALEGLPGRGTAILLAHEPDFADISAATGRFDLQLSGHSHGGQVNVPLSGPPVLPPHAVRYPSGLYQVGGMLQYTNRGIGTVPPRVRVNCRPEITVFTLRAAKFAAEAGPGLYSIQDVLG
jgi:predicted MPP superfamily phosphohydrolase